MRKKEPSIEEWLKIHEEKKCRECIFHFLSMNLETNPDDGFIQRTICNNCGTDHDNWVWQGKIYVNCQKPMEDKNEANKSY